jgi:hypothetical protein
MRKPSGRRSMGRERVVARRCSSSWSAASSSCAYRRCMPLSSGRTIIIITWRRPKQGASNRCRGIVGRTTDHVQVARLLLDAGAGAAAAYVRACRLRRQYHGVHLQTHRGLFDCPGQMPRQLRCHRSCRLRPRQKHPEQLGRKAYLRAMCFPDGKVTIDCREPLPPENW